MASETENPYRDELYKLAAELGEPDDPFAAWEALVALKSALHSKAIPGVNKEMVPPFLIDQLEYVDAREEPDVANALCRDAAKALAVLNAAAQGND